MPTATNQPSSRLATRLRRRQHELLAATDAAGNAVDRQVGRHWSALLALLRAEAKRRKESASLVLPHALATKVRGIVDGMHAETTATVRGRLAGIVHQAYATDARLLARTLPLRTLRTAIAPVRQSPRRSPGRGPWGGRTRVSEAVQPGLATISAGGIKAALDAPTTSLSSGATVSFIQHSIGGRHEVAVWVDPQRLDQDWQKDAGYYLPPGEDKSGRAADFRRFLAKEKAVEASRVVLGDDGEISFVDGRHRFSVLRDDGASRVAVMVPVDQVPEFEARYGAEPAALLPAHADEQRDFISDLLFPPMSIEQAIAILRHPVAGKTWKQDLSQATRLCSPELLLGIIAGGFAAGQNVREIAALLRPAVQGVQTSARRVARTYGMQLAHRVQMDAHEQLGDLLIGYTIHSAKSPNSRWWHVKRDGTQYFKEPGPGQKGYDQMPHPPLEAEDPSERPAGTPFTAWHCLCWLSPILREED